MNVRQQKTHSDIGNPRSIEFFLLPVINETSTLYLSRIYVYEATLLTNVRFSIEGAITGPQTVSYDETNQTEFVAGGPTPASSQAVVIAEKLFNQWYIVKELVLPNAS